MNKFLIFFFFVLFLPLTVKAAGANLYLAPRTGTFTVDSQFSITARVNTGGEEINTAEANIYFDKNLLEVVSVNRGASPFTTWPIEPTYSNAAGTVNFAGGIPQVGYLGADGYLVRIDFKAKKVGATQIGFSTGSALANDGKGTNILSAMSGAAITIAPKVEVPILEEKTEKKSSNDKVVEDKKKSEETPDVEKSVSTTTVDVLPPVFDEAQVDNIVGDWPELKFSAHDAGSGLAFSAVEVDLVEMQEGEMMEATSTLKLSGLTPGRHKALIYITDKAGNEAVRQIDFEVLALEMPVVNGFVREVKSGGQFFANGTAVANGTLDVVLKKDGQLISTSSVVIDSTGNWFFVSDKKLADGKYALTLAARNAKGLRSLPTADIEFLVTQPVFAIVGDYVIKYFTAFTSLIFMMMLLIGGSVYFYRFFRGRVRTESTEAQQITKSYLENFGQIIDEEFTRLKKYENTPNYQKEKDKTRRSLKARLGIAEKKVIKEVGDVEKVMR